MPSMKIIPAIMSGGSGTRLWPLSTDARPKQFHRLGAAHTMIEETALRFSGAHGDITFLDPIIIAGVSHRDLVHSLLADCGVTPSAVVLEPMGRNTAATAALAAMVASEIDPEAFVLLVPADHLVSKPERLIEAVRVASAVASERIITFGITPSGPDTGYGYILQGAALKPGVHHLVAFKEKPDLPEAMRYLREGKYSWNSGMFFFSPKLLLEEFSIASADIRDGAREALNGAKRQGNEILLEAATFGRVRSEAVDRAVMEKTSRAAVVPCDIGWADVGSWTELWRLSQKDSRGNVAEGSVTMLDCMNTMVRSDHGIQVSVIGGMDLIVIASGNSVLVMPRGRAQDVKKVIPGKG